MTCEPGTSPIVYYYDEDLDGTPEDMGQVDECQHDDCWEYCDDTVSDDLDWAPGGTTYHSDHSKGWCYSDLDELIGCTASPSPGECWTMCLGYYGDDLVAIDWNEDGECFCQNDCQCMEDVGDDEGYLITRDTFPVLPQECDCLLYTSPSPRDA